MGCNCKKSVSRQSVQSSQQQQQLEAARQEANAKKQLVHAAPPAGKKPIFRTVGDGHSHDDPNMLRVQ